MASWDELRWWATPVWTRRGFASLPGYSRPPRLPGSLLRILTAGNHRFAAAHALAHASDRSEMLRMILACPGLKRRDLEDLTRWADGDLLEPRTALSVLRHPACSELVAARCAAETWFLGYGEVRALRHRARPPEPADAPYYPPEPELVACFARFPAAAVLLAVVRAFPSTRPAELLGLLPDAQRLTPAVTEVLTALLAEEGPPEGESTWMGRLTPQEIRERFALAEACLATL